MPKNFLTVIICTFSLLATAAAVNVSISSPNSSNVSTSFSLQASASSSYTVTGWWIYVDGNGVWNTAGPTSSISAPLNVGAGSHTIVVRAWDSTGSSGSQTLNINASSGSSSGQSSGSSVSASGVSVSVQSPSNGASVGSPVTFQASGSSPNGIAGWVIYVDDGNAYQVDNYSNSLTATVSLGGGTHRVYIRAWDRGSGFGTSSSMTINVAGGGSASNSGNGALPNPPSSATVFDHIEDMGGFTRCSADCAGGRPSYNYWMAQWQGDPSMDGSSMQFYNGGGPWSNVLFYKSLGANNWATNFLWDFYVYYDSSTIANLHTSEFDLFQAINGVELMVGSQCNFGEGDWNLWDQDAGAWINTSIPCQRFSPGTWHHIQWYIQRVSSWQYKYVTLVVDGNPYSVNRTYGGNYQGWADTVGVQWQLDLGPDGVDAHQWVDRVRLSIW